MRFKIISAIFFLLLAELFFSAEEKLKELKNPESIAVDDQQIYVTEGPKIFIYDRNGFKLKNSFGRDGEGPGEFKTMPRFMPLRLKVEGEKLVVRSMNKVSFFTKDGTFISEEKLKNWFETTWERVKDGYVGFENEEKEGRYLINFNLYNLKKEKVKTILVTENPFSGVGKGLKVFTRNFQFQIAQDKIFVYNSPDFLIDVYKLDGNKLKSIKVDYSLIKLTADQKGATEKFFKEDPYLKQYYELFKPLQFPEYFPAIWYMLVDQKNLIAITYKREGDQQEIYLLDLEGRLIKKKLVKFALKTIIEPYPFTFYNGFLYQLVESAKDDYWHLQSIYLR